MTDIAALEDHFRRAGQAHGEGRYADSLAELIEAGKRHPDSPELHFNIGNVQRDAGMLDAAAQSLVSAIGLAARRGHSYPDALLNLGDVLLRQGRPDKAEEAFGLVMQADTRRTEAYLGLALVRFRAAAYEEAHALLAFALQLDPGNAPVLNHLGLTLERLGRPEDALAVYDRALLADPGRAETRVHRAQLLLLLGRPAEGFAEYEARLATERLRGKGYGGDRPPWQGEDPAGRTILVWGEQGYGDIIQFSRYLSRLSARGARVVLAVEKSLLRLLQTVPGVAHVVDMRLHHPAHDLHAPLLSLPHLLGEADSIPADLPCLTASTADIDRWRERLAPLPGLRVGLVWAGRPEYEFAAERGLVLHQLAPLAAIPGVTLVSLQQGAAATQTFTKVGVELFRPGVLADFADTAGLLRNLDLVIATDTAVPHLAGALGVPTWLLLQQVADWRWGRDGERTPWYPGMRLFRQARQGAWSDVVQRVEEELRRFAAPSSWNGFASPGRGGKTATLDNHLATFAL